MLLKKCRDYHHRFVVICPINHVTTYIIHNVLWQYRKKYLQAKPYQNNDVACIRYGCKETYQWNMVMYIRCITFLCHKIKTHLVNIIMLSKVKWNSLHYNITMLKRIETLHNNIKNRAYYQNYFIVNIAIALP